MAKPPRYLAPNWLLELSMHRGAITAAVLGAMALAIAGLGVDERHAVTIAFLTLAFAQLWHVFDMRGPSSRVLRNEITRNRWVWGALLLCTALILAAVFTPPLAALLDVTRPTPQGWLLVGAASLAPMTASQILTLLRVPPFGGAQESAPR
jgi:Ca2+-transporting ATPase